MFTHGRGGGIVGPRTVTGEHQLGQEIQGRQKWPMGKGKVKKGKRKKRKKGSSIVRQEPTTTVRGSGLGERGRN